MKIDDIDSLEVNMVSCVAVGCSNSSSNSTNLSWHCFPSDKVLRAKWIAKVKRDDLPKNPRLCSEHFEPRMFKRNLRVSSLLIHYTLIEINHSRYY